MRYRYFQLFYRCRQLADNINRPVIRWTNGHPKRYALYAHTIVPLRLGLFLIFGGMYSHVISTPSLQDEMSAAKKNLKDDALFIKLRYDILVCFILYGISPSEYFLFDFQHQDHDQRRTWLSDRERRFGCMKIMGKKAADELRDKSQFYQLTVPFFHRDVFVFNEGGQEEDALDFIRKHPRFISKDLKGSLGQGVEVLDTKDYASEWDLLKHYTRRNHLLEELIEQDDRMAVWNPSSVNTVRIPSFIDRSGRHVILNPTIRTGRRGSVVDNAGAGGVTATIDASSGIICTEGIDKLFHRYDCHPDSGIPFVGTEIPMWQELKTMAEQVHRSLPKRHRYVGFDFALSKNGWVLIEGNWGQLVGSQTSLKKGIRYAFEELMGIPFDSCIQNKN